MILFDNEEWLSVELLQTVSDDYEWDDTVVETHDMIGLTQATEADEDAIISDIEEQTGKSPTIHEIPSVTD